MTEIRRRKQSKEVAGQCNQTEETLIQSNETGLTGETLDQNSLGSGASSASAYYANSIGIELASVKLDFNLQ